MVDRLRLTDAIEVERNEEDKEACMYAMHPEMNKKEYFVSEGLDRSYLTQCSQMRFRTDKLFFQVLLSGDFWRMSKAGIFCLPLYEKAVLHTREYMYTYINTYIPTRAHTGLHGDS